MYRQNTHRPLHPGSHPALWGRKFWGQRRGCGTNEYADAIYPTAIVELFRAVIDQRASSPVARRTIYGLLVESMDIPILAQLHTLPEVFALRALVTVLGAETAKETLPGVLRTMNRTRWFRPVAIDAWNRSARRLTGQRFAYVPRNLR